MQCDNCDRYFVTELPRLREQGREWILCRSCLVKRTGDPNLVHELPEDQEAFGGKEHLVLIVKNDLLT